MFFTKKRRYQETIEAAPGPAPWYLNQPASDLSSPGRPLRWERHPKGGPASLKDSNNNVFALVSIYTYVWSFSKTHFIVWFADSPRNPEQLLVGKVHFQLYALSQLAPLTSVDGSESEASHFVASSKPLAEYQLPRNLPADTTSVNFPALFAQCPELFVLVSDPGWNSAKLNLWTINPSAQSIAVASQDWFTNGSYDFGYQWVTRMAREPVSRDIVGDGIRISSFLLTPDANTFAKWLEDRPING